MSTTKEESAKKNTKNSKAELAKTMKDSEKTIVSEAETAAAKTTAAKTTAAKTTAAKTTAAKTTAAKTAAAKTTAAKTTAAKTTAAKTTAAKTTAAKTTAAKTTAAKTAATETAAAKTTAAKTTTSKTAADEKTAAEAETESLETVSESVEEIVPKTRGRKPKKTVEEESVENVVDEPVNAEEQPAPKRKYTRRKKTDETEPSEDAVIVDAAEDSVKPARKTASKKKSVEEEETKPDTKSDSGISIDADDIETQIYELIKNSSDGIYQNEVWKRMDIDSRKCSRILKKLLDTEQITREDAVFGGTKTYLLKAVSEERKKNYDVLMVKDMFSPCTGCMGECRPEYCPALTYWIMNIHENPEELYASMGYNNNLGAEEETNPEMPPEFLPEQESGEYEYLEEE